MHDYSRGVAAYCDLFAGPADPPDEAAAFLLGLVGDGDCVLDIGAGTGSTAVALAERGIRVTALEPALEMYAMLLARLGRRFDIEPSVTPIPKATGFRTGTRHDVCCCFSVLHLLAPPPQHALVAYATRETKPGGLVVLDMPVHSPARLPRPWSVGAARSLGRLRVEHRSSMLPIGGGKWQTHGKMVSFLGDTVIHEVDCSFDWSPLSHDRSNALLDMHGLTVVGDVAGYDRQPYVPGESRERLVVAEAPSSIGTVV